MNLENAQIAVLAENQYQELELWYPLMRLREEGANVLVVAPTSDQIYVSKLGYPVKPDLAVADVQPADLDAVVIPGGFAPEVMWTSPSTSSPRGFRATSPTFAAKSFSISRRRHRGGTPPGRWNRCKGTRPRPSTLSPLR
jgi:hypothetical protein